MAAATKRSRLGERLNVWEDKPEDMLAKLREELPGKYGSGTSGALDIIWQNALVDYLISKNMRSTFYWCYTPNSGDTGGILDDNLVVRQDKLTLLKKLWGTPPAATSTGIDAQVADVPRHPVVESLDLLLCGGGIANDSGRLLFDALGYFGFGAGSVLVSLGHLRVAFEAAGRKPGREIGITHHPWLCWVGIALRIAEQVANAFILGGLRRFYAATSHSMPLHPDVQRGGMGKPDFRTPVPTVR